MAEQQQYQDRTIKASTASPKAGCREKAVGASALQR